MSKEEIVRTWKNDGPSANTEPDAPANPAGDVSLSDTDLDKVAGGDDMPTLDCTSGPTVCAGTCQIATEGCCTLSNCYTVQNCAT